MAIVLKVSAERLTKAASALSSQGNEMKQETDRMLNLIREISQEVWGGEAAAAYKAKFGGLSGDMARIFSMIREHVSDLNEIAQNYQQAETQNLEVSGSLATDVIV